LQDGRIAELQEGLQDLKIAELQDWTPCRIVPSGISMLQSSNPAILQFERRP
jgi:hypothetical protein